MNPSPLWLESHTFRKIQIGTVDSPVLDDHNRLSCKVSFSQDSNNPLRVQVLLNLKLEAEDGRHPPYLGEFEILGVFRVHESWPMQEVGDLVSTNCPTLLYGAVREMVINLTSRMEHGPISLRTVSFAQSKAKVPESKKPA